MNVKEAVFDIIRFTADSAMYYGASIALSRILLESGEYTKHTDVEIPLGISRYGGPVVDLPPGVDYPDDMPFAAQLDLSKFAPFDKTNLLPATGHLIFFCDIMTDKGKVFYVDVPTDQLVRVVKEHDDNFYCGNMIDKIYAETEAFAERFEDDDEPDDTDRYYKPDEDGQLWNDFAGSEKSKMFGIYYDCQLGREEIEAITFSDKILLLQIGERNGFNDEGVFTVLIDKEDLKNRKFDNCTFNWAQT